MIEKSTSKSITIAKTKFISRDSFAGRRSDPLSLNLYTYCRNNPIRFIDPSGHITVNSQWDWAYYVATGDINYEYDGGSGEVAQRAQNILTYSRASADERAKMKKIIKVIQRKPLTKVLKQ